MKQDNFCWTEYATDTPEAVALCGKDSLIITIDTHSPRQTQDKSLQACRVLTGLILIFFAPLPAVDPVLLRVHIGLNRASGLLIHKDIS